MASTRKYLKTYRFITGGILRLQHGLTLLSVSPAQSTPTMPPKKAQKDTSNLPLSAKFARCKNTLSMGFVGLPNVGKSTITNLLCGANHAEAANYPFCTIDPNEVQCIVPDQKFKYLVQTWKSPSIVPAALKVGRAS